MTSDDRAPESVQDHPMMRPVRPYGPVPELPTLRDAWNESVPPICRFTHYPTVEAR